MDEETGAQVEELEEDHTACKFPNCDSTPSGVDPELLLVITMIGHFSITIAKTCIFTINNVKQHNSSTVTGRGALTLPGAM